MTPRSSRLPLLAALALAAGAFAPSAAAKPRAPKPLTVPVRILVARCPEVAATQPASAAAPQPPVAGALQPVRPREWVDGLLRVAAEVFGPHGVTLAALVEEFQPASCDLEGRAQRDAMARHVTMDGHATVLVVRRVPDLAVPDYDLQGVHWRPPGDRRHYVLLTAKARTSVMAHELCHYFGLPHYKRGGNLMTPGQSDPVWRRRRKPKPHQPILRPAQVQRLRAGVAAFLKAYPTSTRGAAR